MAYPNVLYGPDGSQFELPATGVTKPAGANAGFGGGRPFKYPLGTQLVLQDGRKFRFVEAGGVTLVVGNVQQSAAILTTDQAMTCAVGAINDMLITFTHGAATTVQNYFAEGYASIAVTPGLGDTYKVNNHLALTSAVAGDIVRLDVGNGLRRALTTSSLMTLTANPYSGILIQAATISGAPVGVAVSPIVNAKSGWIQTAGPCAVVCTGTMVIGSPAVMLASGGTAGTPAPASAATQPLVGYVLEVETTGRASMLRLCLDN